MQIRFVQSPRAKMNSQNRRINEINEINERKNSQRFHISG